MIKKSIIISLLLISLWYIYVLCYPTNSANQGFTQRNLSKAQEYIYSEEKIQNVIIGSSLTNRISDGNLKGVTNLSFDGLGPYDGINIILQSEKFPKVLMIEMNYLLNKSIRKSFQDNIFGAFQFYSKKYFSILRTDKQPIAHLNHYFLTKLNKKINEKIGFTTNKNSHIMLKKLIKVYKNIYSKKLNTHQLKNKLFTLDSILTAMENGGTRVVFYEMPVNKQLIEMPLACQTRNEIRRICKMKNISFIEMPPKEIIFETNDGVHLAKKESKIYTEYFLKELDKLNIQLDY